MWGWQLALLCQPLPNKQTRPTQQQRQQLLALAKKFEDAWNSNDAVALAALYTEDAVEVTDQGPIYSREAIEKMYADLFKQVHFSNHIGKPDQYAPHIYRDGWQRDVAERGMDYDS